MNGRVTGTLGRNATADRFVGVVLAVVLAVAAAAPALACDALRVFEDADRNGVFDPGEPVLPGVRVSDGQTVVPSGEDGIASFAGLSPEGILFVIKPPGYVVASSASGLPDFWRAARDSGAGLCGDIALQRLGSTAEKGDAGLKVLLMADPQPKSPVDVRYYREDIVAFILGERGARRSQDIADLGLTLGDVVDDDLSLYPQMIEATASLGVPWLHAAGNHDLELHAGSDQASLRTFRRHFGPDTFAWEEPEASFVVLDDVVALPGQSPGYIGGVRDEQFRFLESYLSQARGDRLLVVALHVPLFEESGRDTFRDADRSRLFGLLEDFESVLVLSGHKHTQRHIFHGPESGWQGAKPLHEYNVGAASGAFWSGVKDGDGIPDATMADGTPNGHATLTVQADGNYALRWHPARTAGDTGIALHAPKVLRQGAWPGFAVYANVYMGHDDTRVEYRIGDGPWQPMTKVAQPDPRLLAENARDDAATTLRGYDRTPEAKLSSHLWRGTLPTDLSAGEHAIEVRAFDDWRGELRASTRYRLETATP